MFYFLRREVSFLNNTLINPLTKTGSHYQNAINNFRKSISIQWLLKAQTVHCLLHGVFLFHMETSQ